MRSLLLFITVLVLYSATRGAISTGDRNDQWPKNDLLVKNLEEFYSLLPMTTWDSRIRSKRFVGVLSSALIYYSASNLHDRMERVLEAVNKTQSRLDLPANALAGPMRTYIKDLKAVIDQPINDVKASCKPNTEQMDCNAALHDVHQKNIEKCREYDRNLNMYQKSRDFIGTPPFTEFINSIKRARNNRDEIALAFFVNLVLVESPDFVQMGRNVYRLRENTTFPCNAGKVATDW